MIQKISIGILGVGIFCFGFFVSMIVQILLQSEEHSTGFILQDFKEPKVPVVSLEKIENGLLKGHIEGGEVRMLLEKESVEVLDSGAFSIDIGRILPMLKILPHPVGTQFVASKRGKNYWALDTPQAFLISAKNRRFFKTSVQAEAQGFKRGKK